MGAKDIVPLYLIPWYEVWTQQNIATHSYQLRVVEALHPTLIRSGGDRRTGLEEQGPAPGWVP